MVTVVNSFYIGEIDTLYGNIYVSIVGIGDTAIKKLKEGLEAAIIKSKF